MAARTTIAEVKEILDDTDLADGIITGYITSANIMVNTVMKSEEYTDLLKEIERWLTAHMIVSTRDRMAAKEGAGGASIEYVGTTGEMLKSTSYGQMVLVLDTSGAFANLGLKQAGVFAVTSFK